jgi:Ca2+-binding RTX toxin-like protein
MIRFFRPKIFLLVLLLLVVLSMGVAVSGANIVPVTGIEDYSQAIEPDDLKPPECSSIHIDRIVDGTGRIRGTGNNDLILGGPEDNTMNGGNGDDCILGGAGNDTINGNKGNDVLLGGPGNDDLDGGQGSNDCYGGGDTYFRCAVH